ncbi:MAG TPA: hypothetical protein VHB18_13700 [Mycobacteriales bacterium]|nr:hypothetical protein [Mycobacteriales bacterium]
MRAETDRFAARVTAFTVLTLGVIGSILVSFTVEHSTRNTSGIVPFCDWQPALVPGLLLFVGLILICAGLLGLRRFKVPAGAPAPAQHRAGLAGQGARVDRHRAARIIRYRDEADAADLATRSSED